ncbi:D-alanyl-D-alanine carboxypeptidase (penicillin-binding protein 5/6) [Verrucomicrobium sp. GAS474]|uniref:D-alanyl-D-alanine carboxypeptidase family protein n=1 Tax=Verrucomicrobium sp. GAS474 TaxID=1882831 RepID=UPI00087C61A3|nr:D-alanyl-D-alanine carboxypeptidase family protein [Verrucomicrobium sp. GAS474]SDU16627.1 D-alanyl-D-alanine carboxypeptidase (penicillin-binding protein 5/6) [Verrucomicrobium sp. GAS474]
MPLLLPLFLLLAILLAAPVSEARSQTSASPTLSELKDRVLAKSALLFDASTGKEIFARNPDTPFPPASTTKLMTALLLYEKKGLAGSMKITAADTGVEPSHVPLIAGETVSISDLVHALLISSDNDAAMALARYVAGSSTAFVDLMNQRAIDLGCTRTHFANPNGLPAPNEYVTAHDLLKIFQKVLTIPELRQIMRLKTYTIETESGTHVMKNHNRLLGLYPGMGPAKTGWTLSSRHTYAASASRDGRELQLIILNSKDKWPDAIAIFNYGFANLVPLAPPPSLKPGPE